MPNYLYAGSVEIAEKLYNSRPDRRAPTAEERDQFIEEWMEKKIKQIGLNEFIREAIAEGCDLSKVCDCWMKADGKSFMIEMKNAVNSYWRPMAEYAAENHEFDDY